MITFRRLPWLVRSRRYCPSGTGRLPPIAGYRSSTTDRLSPIT